MYGVRVDGQSYSRHTVRTCGCGKSFAAWQVWRMWKVNDKEGKGGWLTSKGRTPHVRLGVGGIVFDEQLVQLGATLRGMGEACWMGRRTE